MSGTVKFANIDHVEVLVDKGDSVEKEKPIYLTTKISSQDLAHTETDFLSPTSPQLFRAFSWNAVDEQPEAEKFQDKDDRCCLKCYSLYQKCPLLIRYILYALTGVALIMIPGFVSLFLFVEDKKVYFTDMRPKNKMFAIDGYPFFVWSVYISIIWSSWFGLLWTFRTLPEIIARLVDVFFGSATGVSGSNINTGTKISHYIEYLRYLRGYLAFVIWSAVGLISWRIIFSAQAQSSISDWFNIVSLIWTTLIIGSAIWAVEKLLLQIFAIKFHRRVYKERIELNKGSYKVLSTLNKARKAHKNKHDSPPESASVYTDTKTNASTHKLSTAARDVSKNILTGIGQVFSAAVGIDLVEPTPGIILRSQTDAKMLAKKLYSALAKGPMDDLYPDDFFPYFKNPEDAKAAFLLIDRDGNGDISRQEMKSFVLETFNNRQYLEKSMRSSSQAIEKLDSIFKTIVCIIILFISLSVWNIDTTKFLASLISIWAGLIFAFGGVLKNMVEACIFLFITHPYDVGDRVEIDGIAYFVVEFGITTTILKKWDGREFYAPNIVLLQKLINNVRRSGNMSEEITLSVNYDVTEAQITGLREFLQAFLAENSRDFSPNISIFLHSLNDRNSVELQMFLEHKGNWQDGLKRCTRKSKFMNALKEGIVKFDIPLASNNELDIKSFSIDEPVRFEQVNSKSTFSSESKLSTNLDAYSTGEGGKTRGNL